MRLLGLLVLGAGIGCRPPCSDPLLYTDSFRCPAEARANAAVTVMPAERPYIAGPGKAVARCSVAVDGGSVNLTLERNVCEDSVPAGFSEAPGCTIPPLPAGRWRIAGYDLELPADGGTAIGCP
jgi:hypothetical protein